MTPQVLSILFVLFFLFIFAESVLVVYCNGTLFCCCHFVWSTVVVYGLIFTLDFRRFGTPFLLVYIIIFVVIQLESFDYLMSV